MNNFYFDTHSHVTKKYYDDISEVIEQAKKNNVNYIINSGTSRLDNEELIDLSNKHECMYITLGIHPSEVNNYCDDDIKFIENNLNNSKVVAVGEIGLDNYYYENQKDIQINLLEKQLKLAEKYNLPVVIHSREATLDTINTLKKHKVTGVIHSFSGSYETALEYIKMGYMLGINGVITFKNNKMKEWLFKIDLKNIILETDCPYLTPEPFRGKQNSPANIKYIGEFIAKLYNLPESTIAKVTSENVHRIFDKIL